MLTPPLGYTGPIDALSFTGGGAQYVFEREERDFGDLGPAMGGAVRERVRRSAIEAHEPEQPMRATLLGGTQYRLRGQDVPAFEEPPAFAAARERDRSFVPEGLL